MSLADTEPIRLLAEPRTRKFVNVSIETVCNKACNHCESVAALRRQFRGDVDARLYERAAPVDGTR